MHAAGLPPGDIAPHLDEGVGAVRTRKARQLVEERIRSRKPAAYLMNEAWLGPYRFYVDERVIVPRSFIAELLLGKPGDRPLVPGGGTSGLSPGSVLDLCTGSGCLAILAALRFPKARVDAADLSPDALAVARRNVDDYGLADRIRLVKSDLFGALRGRRYDLILSNPPYVKASSMRKLPEEYRKEPGMALASGVDGLDHTRVILAKAAAHLTPLGRLVVEIGHNRRALEKAFPALDLRWPQTSGGRRFVFCVNRPGLK